MTVTSPQQVDCYEVRVGKEDAPWRRSFRPADPGSRDCCRVTQTLCVPLVRSRRRQLLKTARPPPNAKGRGVSFPPYPPAPKLHRTPPCCRMNHQYPIPQHEPLIGIIRYRRIHRGMADCNTSRRRNHPPDMLI
jgi:hypothetical protein